MFNLRQFGISERSIFQHAVELALAQPHIDLRPAGHIALENRARGGRYAYWMRYNHAKKLSKKYLGVEGSEAHLEAVAMLDEQEIHGRASQSTTHSGLYVRRTHGLSDTHATTQCRIFHRWRGTRWGTTPISTFFGSHLPA